MSLAVQERIKREAMLEKTRNETIEQIRNKSLHIRRVTNGESEMNLRAYNVKEVFAKDYRKFAGCYTREQLQYLENSFLSADGDGDFRLSEIELMHWFQKQGYPLSNDEVLGLLEMGDADMDGFLTFDEFVILCLLMEIRNIPKETKFIAGKTIEPDFQYFITNVNHYKEKQKEEENSSPPKSTAELIRERAEHVQQRLSVVRKFSSIVLPGLKDRGSVNIAQIIDYFETEIVKQSDLKSWDVQAKAMMSKAKENYKRNPIVSAVPLQTVQSNPLPERRSTQTNQHQTIHTSTSINTPARTERRTVYSQPLKYSEQQLKFPSIAANRKKIKATASRAIRNIPHLKASVSKIPPGVPQVVQESIKKAKELGIPPFGTNIPPTRPSIIRSHNGVAGARRETFPTNIQSTPTQGTSKPRSSRS